LLAAYIFIAIVVLVRYREFNALWLITIPICSSAILVIISQMMGFSLNLFHVMALFLVLGFGMDYTIFAREIRPPHDITIQAILLSAITSLLSFGLLGLSSIPIVSSFGITLLIGNFFNLLGVIIYSHCIQKSAKISLT
jgi:predicted exporter